MTDSKNGLQVGAWAGRILYQLSGTNGDPHQCQGCGSWSDRQEVRVLRLLLDDALERGDVALLSRAHAEWERSPTSLFGRAQWREMQKEREAEALLHRTVVCPYCGADKGEPCHSTKGGKQVANHADRRRTYQHLITEHEANPS